jgi:hypothetical protein
LGVKLLGGHLPLSPETTIAAIQAANDAGCYAAFHCGSTKNGSNLHGLLDALEFAGDNRLQICHVNAYCRGLTHGSPAEETLLALKALDQRPHLVSESHMGPLNSCWSRLNEKGPAPQPCHPHLPKIRGLQPGPGRHAGRGPGWLHAGAKAYPSEMVYWSRKPGGLLNRSGL